MDEAEKQRKVRIILESKRKTDLRGLLRAQRENRLNEYLQPDLEKAGLSSGQYVPAVSVRRASTGGAASGGGGKKSGKEALLLWCQMNTAIYPNVSVTNFTSSWVDGLAFCALLHRFAGEGNIKFSTLSASNAEVNLTLAFSKAEEIFDIYPIIDLEDLTQHAPDAKVIVTYLSFFFHKLSKMEPASELADEVECVEEEQEREQNGKDERQEEAGLSSIFTKSEEVAHANDTVTQQPSSSSAKATTSKAATSKPSANKAVKKAPRARHSIAVSSANSFASDNPMAARRAAAAAAAESFSLYNNPMSEKGAGTSDNADPSEEIQYEMQGWLYKRSQLAWKRRYFVRESEMTLNYFAKYKTKMKGQIDLAEITDIVASSDFYCPIGFEVFKLVGPSRTWTLACEKGTREQWMKHLAPPELEFDKPS
jgi:hypothetical protein